MTTATKVYPDSGALYSTATKKGPKSPDYFGSITINLKDTTGFVVEDGMTKIKLSGWKKTSSSGKTFLSVSVDRYVPQEEKSQSPVSKVLDEEDPF